MNTFSLRVRALLLSASLVCISVCAMEDIEVMQIVVMEDANSDVIFEEEEVISEDQTAEVVWYKRKEVQQRIACAVAAAYVIAVCTGKVRSPLALLTAFGGLFAKKVVENNENSRSTDNQQRVEDVQKSFVDKFKSIAHAIKELNVKNQFNTEHCLPN